VKMLSRLYVKKVAEVLPTTSDLLLAEIRDLLAARAVPTTKD